MGSFWSKCRLEANPRGAYLQNSLGSKTWPSIKDNVNLCIYIYHMIPDRYQKKKWKNYYMHFTPWWSVGRGCDNLTGFIFWGPKPWRLKWLIGNEGVWAILHLFLLYKYTIFKKFNHSSNSTILTFICSDSSRYWESSYCWSSWFWMVS